MAALSCAHCGVQVPGAARVCPKCGHVFTSHERAAVRDLRRAVGIVVALAAIAGAVLALLLVH